MINIYGKGGHAKVISSVLKSRHPKRIAFWNDEDFDLQEGNWIIAIGNNADRKRIAEEVLGEIEYLTIISETSIISGNSEIDQGSQILHGAVIQIGTKIGKHCIVNTAASIDHDCILEDFTFIGTESLDILGTESGIGIGLKVNKQ